MQIRYIESFAHFIYQKFQNLHSFGTLHVVAESTDEGRTVSRHVDFRNQEHLTCLAVFHQFLGFFEGIVLARHSCHVLGIVQHREYLALQAPCLVFGKVPMKHIDLVSGKHVDFAFEFIEGDVASSVVLHESANLESRPVHDAAALDVGSPVPLACQLAKCLHGPINSLFRRGFHGNRLIGHRKTIGFFLIQLGTFDSGHDLHFDKTGCLLVGLSTQFGYQCLPFGLKHGCGDFHLVQQESASLGFHLLGFREQHAIFLCHYRDLSEEEQEEQKNGSFYHNIVFNLTGL